MPEPKKRLTRTRRGNRRSQSQTLGHITVSKCAKCKSAIKPHTVCSFCGYYKNTKIFKTGQK